MNWKWYATFAAVAMFSNIAGAAVGVDPTISEVVLVVFSFVGGMYLAEWLFPDAE